MPEISRFKGLVISMYHHDHGVPHFHVRYAEFFATIDVESERVNGELPRRVRSIALEWARVHRAELLDNWSRARHGVVRFRIDPLE